MDESFFKELVSELILQANLLECHSMIKRGEPVDHHRYFFLPTFLVNELKLSLTSPLRTVYRNETAHHIVFEQPAGKGLLILKLFEHFYCAFGINHRQPCHKLQ